MADQRTAGWVALRKARRSVERLRLDSLDAADRAVKDGERQQAEWWTGRADGLLSADSAILAEMNAAKARKVRR